MLRKNLRIVTVLLLVCVLFSAAGCAKAGEQPADTQSAQGAEEQTTQPPKEVTLSYAIWDYSTSPEYGEVIEAFHSEYPNIKVEAMEITAAEYSDKLTIMLAGGDTTDIIGIKDMPNYSGLVSKNQLDPIDDRIAQDNLNMGPYAGITENVKLNDKLYTLPYRSDFWVLYYNKDIFDNAGVSYPTNDMTFEQFRELAKKVTSGSGNDKVYGAYAHTWKSCILNWAVADGKGTMIDGTYDFFKPAYEVFLGMQNEDESIMDLATAKISSAHYKGQFESGNTAMLLMGTWFIGTLITDKKDGTHDVNWSMVKVPHFEGAQSGTTFGNVTGSAINALSKNKDEAWEFIKYLCTEKGAQIFAARGVMPAYRTDAVLGTYMSVDGFPEDGKEALETSSVALEFPPHKHASAIDKYLQEEHELIMIGENDIDKGIETMNRRVQEVLSED